MYRESFTPGTNVCGWLTIIMRNTFYSGQRKRVHEVEDTDGSYAAQLVTLPAQGAVLDLEDVNAAIGRLSTTLPRRSPGGHRQHDLRRGRHGDGAARSAR